LKYAITWIASEIIASSRPRARSASTSVAPISDGINVSLRA